MAQKSSSVTEEAVEELRNDIARFSDPTSEVSHHHRPTSTELSWVQRGDRVQATFHWIENAFREVTVDGARITINTFFARPALGDLDAIARNTVRLAQDSLYVDTKAKLSDVEAAETANAVELLTNLVDDHLGGLASARVDARTTGIPFVTGNAGAGKTRVLRRLAGQRAKKFINREVGSLYLYVNAQGRALASFDEALAFELDALRSHLFFDAVPVLVRRGLLIPVVDGFDELISVQVGSPTSGASGHEGAFGSLDRFIATLQGRGALIASGRSAFYETEFALRYMHGERSSRRTWSLFPVEVQPWDEPAVRAFVAKKCEFEGLRDNESDSVIHAVEATFRSPTLHAVAGRPLFVAKVADRAIEVSRAGTLNSDNPMGPISSAPALVRVLARQTLYREVTDKLKARAREGAPGGVTRSVLDVEQLQRLLAQIADEMWALETRELDMKSIREVATLVCEEFQVQGKDREVVLNRLGVMPVLVAAPNDRRSFEHELFFAHFLAQTIIAMLVERSAALGWLLRRNRLPPMTGELVAVGMLQQGINLRKELDALCALRLRDDDGFVRENRGALVHGMIVHLPQYEATTRVENLRVARATFADVSFGAVRFDECEFDEVEFRSVNLRSTAFMRCQATSLNFFEPIVDPDSTKFDLVGLEWDAVHGVRELDERSVTTFVPSEVRRVLARCGLPSAVEAENTVRLRDVDPWVVETLKSIMGRFLNSPHLYFTDRWAKNFTKDQRWEPLLDALEKSGVLDTGDIGDATGKGGRPFHVTCVNPEELMRGLDLDQQVDPIVKAFWERVER